MTKSEAARILAPLGADVVASIFSKNDEADMLQIVTNYIGDNTVRRLSVTESVNMKAGSEAAVIYTVPTGKLLIIDKVVVYDNSATLAGGTKFSVTGQSSKVWRIEFTLATMTTAGDTITVRGADLGKYEPLPAGAVNFVKTIGSTGNATATVELWGHLINA